MPSHMPTYYKWAQDRPCTTNAEYGYTLRDSNFNDGRTNRFNGNKPRSKSTSPLRHAATNSSSAASKPSRERFDTSTLSPLSWKHPSMKSKPINRGYITGYVPVSMKASKDNRRVGVNLVSSGSSPEAYQYPESNSKDTYLWHALSGTLVHCKNNANNM